MWKRIVLVVTGLAAAAGCAGYPPPQFDMEKVDNTGRFESDLAYCRADAEGKIENYQGGGSEVTSSTLSKGAEHAVIDGVVNGGLGSFSAGGLVDGFLAGLVRTDPNRPLNINVGTALCMRKKCYKVINEAALRIGAEARCMTRWRIPRWSDELPGCVVSVGKKMAAAQALRCGGG